MRRRSDGVPVVSKSATLPSVLPQHSAKWSVCRVFLASTRQNDKFAECFSPALRHPLFSPSVVFSSRQSLCRVPDRKHSAKLLFAGTVDVVCSLPSVTLGKSFAECFSGFAECLWHTAKLLFPVVFVSNIELARKSGHVYLVLTVIRSFFR